MNESVQSESKPDIRAAQLEWWQAPVQFAVHVLVGAFLFTIVAIAAFSIEALTKWLGTIGLNSVMVVGLKAVEFAIFATDLMLFIIFLWRTTKRAVKEM